MKIKRDKHTIKIKMDETEADNLVTFIDFYIDEWCDNTPDKELHILPSPVKLSECPLYGFSFDLKKALNGDPCDNS